jgi:hypothetical protein
MKKNNYTTAAFSLMDLPLDERMKPGDQIMERALAHWRNKQSHRPSAISVLRRAEREAFKQRR